MSAPADVVTQDSLGDVTANAAAGGWGGRGCRPTQGQSTAGWSSRTSLPLLISPLQAPGSEDDGGERRGRADGRGHAIANAATERAGSVAADDAMPRSRRSSTPWTRPRRTTVGDVATDVVAMGGRAECCCGQGRPGKEEERGSPPRTRPWDYHGRCRLGEPGCMDSCGGYRWRAGVWNVTADESARGGRGSGGRRRGRGHRTSTEDAVSMDLAARMTGGDVSVNKTTGNRGGRRCRGGLGIAADNVASMIEAAQTDVWEMLLYMRPPGWVGGEEGGVGHGHGRMWAWRRGGAGAAAWRKERQETWWQTNPCSPARDKADRDRGDRRWTSRDDIDANEHIGDARAGQRQREDHASRRATVASEEPNLASHSRLTLRVLVSLIICEGRPQEIWHYCLACVVTEKVFHRCLTLLFSFYEPSL